MKKVPAPYRSELPLNTNWSFRRGRAPERKIVDLPHCWNERDTFQQGITYYQGQGVYQKTLAVPASDRPHTPSCWQLRSEGFYGFGDLWINGSKICRFDGQYIGLGEDVTAWIRPGTEHDIKIRVRNTRKRYVLPGKKDPDFLLYGGLAGKMRLLRLPAIHLKDRSLRVLCEGALSSHATVRVSVPVRNRLTVPQTVRVIASVTAMSGEIVASETSAPTPVPPEGEAVAQVALRLDHPLPWDIERPHLYRVECALRMGEETIDTAGVRFGAREAFFDGNDGFFLNRNRVFLQGVNRHESMPGFGNALPDELHQADARLIRGMGLNFVRLSHYPQSPAFLDACDEAGLLVYAEIASWKSVRPGLWARAACRQLKAMMERDRNHPSVILWGFGNEARSRIVYRKMQSIADALDPGRATIYAENHLHRGMRRRTLKQTDVLGINYELDRLRDAHACSRNGSLVVSETGNYAHTVRGETEAEIKQIKGWEQGLGEIVKHPYVAGYALWCFADHATQRKGRYLRQSGVVDAWRVPKMSASYIRAATEKRLYVSVHGDWGTGNGNGKRRIHVFSNAERLLITAGNDLLAEMPAQRYTAFDLPFRAETLEVTACRNGERQTARLHPWNGPEAIILDADQGECSAANRETVGVSAKVVDAKGITVSDYHGELRVAAEGPGRIRFFTPRDIIEVFAGTGRFFVTGMGTPGAVTLHCSAAGINATATSIIYA